MRIVYGGNPRDTLQVARGGKQAFKRSAILLSSFLPFVSLAAVSGAQLTDVRPRVISTKGGTEVTSTGSGFSQRVHVARINGIVLSPQTFVSETTIRGSSPALNAGSYEADIFNTATGRVEPNPVGVRAVEPGPVPTVTSVEPYWL